MKALFLLFVVILGFCMIKQAQKPKKSSPKFETGDILIEKTDKKFRALVMQVHDKGYTIRFRSMIDNYSHDFIERTFELDPTDLGNSPLGKALREV
jgi:hypothetical protein